MKFLTTDVFLSFLTETDTPRGKAARAIFETVEAGKEKITTAPVVFYELITVLHSPAGFDQPKDRIVDVLSKLLILRSFILDDKQVWTDALTIWREEPVELIDALNRAYTRHHGIPFTSASAKHASR